MSLQWSLKSHGGEILYIDEIHKYHEWSIDIKSLYDSSRLKLVISGSSMIQINRQQADLSRRVIPYRLANLSFREYLLFKNIADFSSYSFEEILSKPYKYSFLYHRADKAFGTLQRVSHRWMLPFYDRA